jgi:hypothetical protein
LIGFGCILIPVWIYEYWRSIRGGIAGMYNQI